MIPPLYYRVSDNQYYIEAPAPCKLCGAEPPGLFVVRCFGEDNRMQEQHLFCQACLTTTETIDRGTHQVRARKVRGMSGTVRSMHPVLIVPAIPEGCIVIPPYSPGTAPATGRGGRTITTTEAALLSSPKETRYRHPLYGPDELYASLGGTGAPAQIGAGPSIPDSKGPLSLTDMREAWTSDSRDPLQVLQEVATATPALPENTQKLLGGQDVS